MTDVAAVVTLLVRLGLAVWDAVESGNRHRTVGEIFDAVPKDGEEIERLREQFKRKHPEPRS